MKANTKRKLLRFIHLFGAGAIGTYVYAPFKHAELFTLLMQAVVLPVLTLTGIWLWLGPKLKNLSLNKLLIVKTEQVVDGRIVRSKTSRQ